VSKNANAVLLALGKKIRRIRISQKISQNQLAYETNLSREYINKVESGKSNISIKKLNQIADAFNIDIKEFFD
jgi:transcriptional regulator with XRE-family HTH domain